MVLTVTYKESCLIFAETGPRLGMVSNSLLFSFLRMPKGQKGLIRPYEIQRWENTMHYLKALPELKVKSLKENYYYYAKVQPLKWSGVGRGRGTFYTVLI